MQVWPSFQGANLDWKPISFVPRALTLRMKRNPHRAYDRDGQEAVSNMREHGVRSVEATCKHCKHEATVNVDSLSDDLYVSEVALSCRVSYASHQATH